MSRSWSRPVIGVVVAQGTDRVTDSSIVQDQSRVFDMSL